MAYIEPWNSGEKGFFKSRSYNEQQWKHDLTEWLKKCKDKTNITDDEFKKWDDLLNSGSSKDDISSFCEYTGWIYRY